MKRFQIHAGVVLAVLAGLPPVLAAQTAPLPPPAAGVASQGTGDVATGQVDAGPRRRDVLRIGGDYALAAGDSARDVVVIAAGATIEGRVDGDVVVVLGHARIASTAVIDGSLVVVGGAVTIAPEATVRRDLVVVGGPLNAPTQFAAGGDHVVIGPLLGRRMDDLITWITRGLLWGRPIVPSLPWVWAIVGVFFLVYLLLNQLFERPVRASADTLAGKPLTAFLVGVLVLLLVGPVSVLLAVSVVGLMVVPIVLLGLFAATIVGKVATARWIGTGILRQPDPDSRSQAMRSFAIGFAVMILAYMIPVLGFMAWTMLSVLGLGAATLAFISAYRRENPLPLPAPLVALPPAVPPSAEAPGTFGPELALFARATFRDRLAAGLLDLILVLIALQFLDPIVRGNGVFLTMLAYFIGFWSWKGTTVGGIICQLRVVRVDHAPLRFADALVRGLACIFSMAVVGLGFLWILKDPERQAWHDKIAGTYVVKVPKNWPL